MSDEWWQPFRNEAERRLSLRLAPPLVHVTITTRRTPPPFDWAASDDPYICDPRSR